jgi:hypothetical protein
MFAFIVSNVGSSHGIVSQRVLRSTKRDNQRNEAGTGNCKGALPHGQFCPCDMDLETHNVLFLAAEPSQAQCVLGFICTRSSAGNRSAQIPTNSSTAFGGIEEGNAFGGMCLPRGLGPPEILASGISFWLVFLTLLTIGCGMGSRSARKVFCCRLCEDSKPNSPTVSVPVSSSPLYSSPPLKTHQPR